MTLSSYELGRIAASLVLLALAVGLLRSGLRRPGNLTRAWVGVALLALTAVNGYGQALASITKDGEVEEIRVALPPTLLGLRRHDSFVDSALRTRFLTATRSLDESDLGFYGSPFGGVTVTAGRGDLDDPGAFVDGFLKGARAQGAPTGAASSTGACAKVSLKRPGVATSERFACAWADSRSFVGTVDGEARSLAEAEERSREMRSGIVRAADEPLPSAPPVPRTPVVIDMPESLLGLPRNDEPAFDDIFAFRLRNERYASTLDMGLFAASGQGFLVEALATDLSSHIGLVRHVRSSLTAETGREPGNPVPVAAGGPRTGEGYCWQVSYDGTPTVVCLLVDDAAYVIVYDFGSVDVADSAARARQVRAIVERRNS